MIAMARKKKPTNESPAGRPVLAPDDPPRPDQGCGLPPLDGWPRVWTDFTCRYPAWVTERLAGGEPVYRLPNEVVDHLADPTRLTKKKNLSPIFTTAQADAERAFTHLCRIYLPDVVGVWNDRPVRYGLLGDPPPRVTSQQVTGHGWDRSDLNDVLRQACEIDGISGPPPRPRRAPTAAAISRDLAELDRRAATYRQELLGWVGWLLFDPKSTFRGRLAELRDRDSGLGGVLSWPFSPGLLNSPAPDGRPQPAAGDARLGESQARLLEDAVRLVWDHQLGQLVTWDLPDPQGVLEAVPLGLAARILNPEHHVLVVPAFSNRPGGEELAQFRRRLQHTNAHTTGLVGNFPTPGIAGREGAPSDYGRAVQLWFVEYATRSRFPGRDVPRGLVARLREVFAALYELTPERVQVVRRVYAGLFLPTGPRGIRRR